jgi:uncharacterized protein YjdB
MHKRTAAPVFGFLMLLLLALVACHGFFESPKLTSLTVSPQSTSVVKGGTQQFTATGVNDDGSTTNVNSVTWTSSDTAVATVSSTGLAKAVAAGTATITATSQSVTGSATLTVNNSALQSISVTPQTASILLGQTQQFRAQGTFADPADNKDITTQVTWNSDNINVATISNTSGSEGLATASTVNTGTANITATSGSVTSNTAVLTVQ